MTDFRRPTELEILAGHWDTTGTVIGEKSPFEAVDIYEWMPGGYFLLHHVEAEMGGAEVRALEVIGADPGGSGYVTWSFDNSGGALTYRAQLDGRKWSIDGEAERFRGEVSPDGRTLEGQWSQKRGGQWVPWMDIALRKRPTPRACSAPPPPARSAARDAPAASAAGTP
jgi:hypothetical protein